MTKRLNVFLLIVLLGMTSLLYAADNGREVLDNGDCNYVAVYGDFDADCHFYFHQKEIDYLNKIKCTPIFWEVVGNKLYYTVIYNEGELRFYPVKADIYLKFLPTGEIVKVSVEFNNQTCGGQ